MRTSFAFLITSIAAAALMTGCAKQVAAPAADNVDIQKAKKLKMPVVIYNVGVKKDERGMRRPVVYFLNTSSKPVTMATFYVQGVTADGKTVTLWADDYEKVPPGKTSKKGMLGGGWSNADVTCVEIRKAGLHINEVDYRFTEDNIAQLFLDQTLNHCK